MTELLNEIKSATINTQKNICLKATRQSQADQHVQYTECLVLYHQIISTSNY